MAGIFVFFNGGQGGEPKATVFFGAEPSFSGDGSKNGIVKTGKLGGFRKGNKLANGEGVYGGCGWWLVVFGCHGVPSV